MVGFDLIVKPVLEKDATTYTYNLISNRINVWLPKGETWYNVFTRERLVGTGEHIKVGVTID